ncbi:cysteine desulfurase [Putridiphycobacter roseus]|uniref:cysteine desulfurase n=1 Tax=Putridiphycobacter roseus TaxID=2219161 RepID=A0A2W1NMG7_9FLAO|nr:cysteine desulfurase family protein [Putridiphycobacter roseus]PZE16842.1 cysteine desulfurase [Putridiphycobacter roseus]
MNVYLDNAATTPMTSEVVDAMTTVLRSNFGNPSSIHSFGREAKAIIENARRSIAKLVNCVAKEIIFTSGGTEADNMAILCSIKDLGVNHVITTSIEHHAVGHAVDAAIEKYGVKLSKVKLTENGHVDLDDLVAILEANRADKILVSLMHANNEVGNLLPIKKVSEICRKYEAYFHSDTVQTMGHYAIDIAALDIDFLTCSAHKFHGPKGVGFLYVNKNLKINPLIEGGAQERGLRGGTENISGIVGLKTALELANEETASHQAHVQGLKTYMIERLRSEIEDVRFHGDIDPAHSLYTVLNVCFPNFKKQEMLLFMLDLEGVACSGGSACTAGANMGSHVLRGLNADTSRSNVRFSFSRFTTKEEIDFAMEKIHKIMKED